MGTNLRTGKSDFLIYNICWWYFYHWRKEVIKHLDNKKNLLLFEVMSNLKVNFNKILLIWINIHQRWLEEVTQIMNCQMSLTPFKYIYHDGHSKCNELCPSTGHTKLCKLQWSWWSKTSPWCCSDPMWVINDQCQLCELEVHPRNITYSYISM